MFDLSCSISSSLVSISFCATCLSCSAAISRRSLAWLKQKKNRKRKKYNVGRTTFSRHKIAVICTSIIFPPRATFLNSYQDFRETYPWALIPRLARHNIACWQVDNFHSKHFFPLELRDNIYKAHLFKHLDLSCLVIKFFVLVLEFLFQLSDSFL